MRFTHKTIKILSAVLLSAVCLSVQAQSGKLEKANRLFEEEAYPDAIRLYKKVLKKKPVMEAREHLAVSYEKTGQYGQAMEQYRKLVNLPAPKNIYYFDYGRLLKMNGRYEEAQDNFEKYRQTGENTVLAMKYKQSCDFAMDLMEDSLKYEIKPESYNKYSSDFGPEITSTGILFTSSRNRGFFSRVLNRRSNDYFYDLYFAESVMKGGKPTYKVKPVRGKVNTRFHEGPAVLDKEGSTMYFTRSNFLNGKRKTDGNGVNNLKIFSAKRVGKKWKEVEPLPFNSDEYSVGHPALTRDGNAMVFASDMPGGFGGSDLYVVRKEGDAWSQPENLGPVVNSLGDELFPSLTADGTLMFSSDGHPGMGGLDIFFVKREDSRWGEVRNAGYPLNGPADDFGTSMIAGKARGYMSSNRDGGEGRDDIYNFERQMTITGTIVAVADGEPMEGVEVSVMDDSGVPAKYTTDENGRFEVLGKYGKDYFFTANKPEYVEEKLRLPTRELSPLEDPEVRMEMERDLHFDIAGKVTDAKNGSGLNAAKIRLKKTTGSSRVGYADGTGQYEEPLDMQTEYTVFVGKEGYIPKIATVSTMGKSETELFRVDAELEKGRFILVEGQVVRKDNSAPLPDATVHTVDLNTRKEIQRVNTNKAGQFNIILDPGVEQMLLVSSKNDYFTARMEVPVLDSTTNDTTIYPTIELVPWEVGQVVKIIYYEYNKSNILNESSKDLFEIVYFLEDNPAASVELGSHTDSRGSASYNQELSQRRGDAAVGFIVDQGIEKSRIESKGYGESQLTNDCKDGAKCTDEAHGKNRRTEIKIIKIDDDKKEIGLPGSLKIDKSKIKELQITGKGKDKVKREN